MKVVTIGAGYFARFHVDAWVRMTGVGLAALVDHDVAKARALLDDLGRPDIPAGDTPDVIFADQRPDIIDIAVPPAAHLGMIRRACATGARMIICQKPFCTSRAEAAEATALAEAAGKTLVIHENFRFQPWYRTLKVQIEAGRIGQLYQIGFRLRPGDGQGPQAYLARQPYFQDMPRFLIHETGIHWIDTFRYLLGEPESVLADLRRLNPAIQGEDAGFFQFRYGDGRRAMFDGNRLVDHAADNPRLTMGEALVEGSDGVIALDGDGTLRFRATGSRDWQGIAVEGLGEGFGGGCVQALQSHVVAHLLTGAPLENTAREYLRNIDLEEAVYRAADTGTAQYLPA